MTKFLSLLAVLCVFSNDAFAGKQRQQPPILDESALPTCVDRNRSAMRSNNEEVIRWKTATENQYKDRALVIGSLVSVLQERKSHLHIQIDMDPTSGQGTEDHIEIIYNRAFGEVDKSIHPGMPVAACGDYITSRERAGNYPASPVGAIVHWVHASNNPGKHAHGFLSIAGVIYGNEGEASNGQHRYLEALTSILSPSFL